VRALVLRHEVFARRGGRVSGWIIFVGTRFQAFHHCLEGRIEKEWDGVALAIGRGQNPVERAVVSTVGPDFQHVLGSTVGSSRKRFVRRGKRRNIIS
jgi:hypothetical protein